MREHESTKAAIIAEALGLAHLFDNPSTALYRAMDNFRITNRQERKQLYTACIGTFKGKLKKKNESKAGNMPQVGRSIQTPSKEMFAQLAKRREHQIKAQIYEDLGLDNPGYSLEDSEH